MRNPVGALGAVAAGALAMYYLDPELGERRRALLADLVRSGLPGERRGRARARLSQRASHVLAMAPDPQSDAELRDRIQRRLGAMVSYPRAIHIRVEHGVVRLSGRVLAKECEGLVDQVQRMPGVHGVVNGMSAHDLPVEIAAEGLPQQAPPASEPLAA